jgi:hypothetical protein
MKKEENKKEAATGKEKFPGYPHYPQGQDIYYNDREEQEIDPEDPSKIKSAPENPESLNEKDFEDSQTGEDLDVPGNEADEENLTDTMPDEENNYYSLGGDNHDNLEEDQGS